MKLLKYCLVHILSIAALIGVTYSLVPPYIYFSVLLLLVPFIITITTVRSDKNSIEKIGDLKKSFHAFLIDIFITTIASALLIKGGDEGTSAVFIGLLLYAFIFWIINLIIIRVLGNKKIS